MGEDTWKEDEAGAMEGGDERALSRYLRSAPPSPPPLSLSLSLIEKS